MCVCMYGRDVGGPLTTPVQLISNVVPARCNPDHFFFCYDYSKILTWSVNVQILSGVTNLWRPHICLKAIENSYREMQEL